VRRAGFDAIYTVSDIFVRLIHTVVDRFTLIWIFCVGAASQEATGAAHAQGEREVEGCARA
jgi:hypothetical protein